MSGKGGEVDKDETTEEGQAQKGYLLACGIILLLVAIAILVLRVFQMKEGSN